MRWMTAVSLAEKIFAEQKDFCWKTNKILIRGVVKEKFSFHHNVRSEKFYLGTIITLNGRGTESTIPIIANENLIGDFKENQTIEIIGEIRTFIEVTSNGNKKTFLYVYAKQIKLCSEEVINIVELNGSVEKLSFRTVASGKVFANILMRVQRNSGTDYIDCIAWGDEFYHSLKIGDKINVLGKIQNKIYFDNKHNMKKSDRYCVIWGMQLEILND